MQKAKRLQDEYRFPGYRPQATIKGIFGDPEARVVVLRRRQKKRFAGVAATLNGVFTTAKPDESEIYRVVRNEYLWKWKSGEYSAKVVAR